MAEHNNDVCELAAQMLNTQTGLLDYRLVEYLNELDALVHISGGHVASRQIVALAILTWRHSVAEDFTDIGHPKGVGRG